MEKEENIIIKVCKELDMQQADLARMLDVTPARISEWKNGSIPKMSELALNLMLENKELKQHLKNVKRFYETLQKI